MCLYIRYIYQLDTVNTYRPGWLELGNTKHRRLVLVCCCEMVHSQHWSWCSMSLVGHLQTLFRHIRLVAQVEASPSMIVQGSPISSSSEIMANIYIYSLSRVYNIEHMICKNSFIFKMCKTIFFRFVAF